MWRNNSLISLFMGSFFSLPSPANLSYWWNMGSLLGLFLVIQIVSGLFLTMHYASNIEVAFDSVSKTIGRDSNYGWVFRSIHANGASVFLALIYLHMGRGIYYKRYGNLHTWSVGVVLLALSMLTAFLGYVLPWGQMSFWGATVITNLMTAIPIWGGALVTWVWGGFSVDNAALNRFYTLHFLVPFIIGVMALVHLVVLHEEGSGNPLGVFSSSFKIFFWPYFGVKDILGALFVLSLFLGIVFLAPDMFGDPDNFYKANPMVTPVHIKPEWYFLFAYAILRCIPNKGMGVFALVLSIVVFFFLPWVGGVSYLPTVAYQMVVWLWVANFFLLTWLGGCPVKDTFTHLAQVSGFLYFSLIILFVWL
uniref:Cytochrome b n=1 Tax=Phallusia mammillata TaxID=59560 RepID=A7WL60_9ASCI|nr:cytochrome b [Phallusia mammillata]CAL23073.2 cytochrome b [Phallusia mammillata]